MAKDIAMDRIVLKDVKTRYKELREIDNQILKLEEKYEKLDTCVKRKLVSFVRKYKNILIFSSDPHIRRFALSPNYEYCGLSPRMESVIRRLERATTPRGLAMLLANRITKGKSYEE